MRTRLELPSPSAKCVARRGAAPVWSQALLDKAKAGAKAADAEAVRARAELEGAASEQEALAARTQEAQASCAGEEAR